MSRMLTLHATSPTALANFTDLANLQPLPSQIKNKWPGLFDRDPSCDQGLHLLSDHNAERALAIREKSHSSCNSTLEIISAGWIARQFYQSRTKLRSKSQALETPNGCRRLLDYLEAILTNLLPQSSGKNRRDVSPNTASTENLSISGQAKNSRSPWHPSNIIFATDYDVTCTLVDSCKVLVRAAEVAALKRPDKDISVPWQPGNFLREYKAALRRHAERTRSTVQTLFSEHKDSEKDCEASSCSPRSGRDMFNPQGEHEMKLSVKALSNESTDGVKLTQKLSPYREAELRMALTKLAMLEIMCNQDVNSLGVLRGPTREEIRAEAAVRVRLRANCSKVLQRLAHSGTKIHVVSANWSRDLIVGGLPKLPDDKFFIHSNDLVFDSAGRSLGIIDGKVVDAFDKEELLRALRSSHDAKTFAGNRVKTDSDSRPRLLSAPHMEINEMDGNDAGKSILVYVGDSHTDLLGLLDADLGIVMGESLLMRRIMALFSIQLRPLAEASTRISVARVSNSMLSYRRSGYLFEARSWIDVETCLFGGKAAI